jgi:glucose-6-phosphate 1-dehydrogenase
MVAMKPARSDVLVFFGSTGDLAFKQIFPALQALVRHGRLDMPIVNVGRKDVPIDDLRARAKESITENGALDAAAFAKLSAQMSYVKVDYDDPATFANIRKAIGGAKHPLHYVALPPEVFESVATNLAKTKLNEGARLSLEKPFGHDQASALALSALLHKYFPEESIFRIDHYLGKETVENLVYFRAANPLIEASLHRQHVDCVEISMAESFGVKGRAGFYDAVGAVRDVVQNHLLEVVACLAMELPTSKGTAGVGAARSALLAQVRALTEGDIVRGQVRGYGDEKGVAKGSTTETFAALRLFIDSPRWQGVPFFIRTGKSLPLTATEATIRWKRGACPVLEENSPPAPNYVRFRLGPDNAIALSANVKKDGEAMVGERAELVLRRSPKNEMKPYERLIGDALDGDQSMFAAMGAVEQSWRVVDPIVGKAQVFPYDAGTWGPAEAKRIQPSGGWSDPKKD